MKLTGGDLTGPGSFQLDGGLFSQNGFLFGTTVQAASARFTNGGGFALNARNSTLQFAGGTWDSGQIQMTNSTLLNAGAFTISSTDSMIRDVARPVDNSNFQNTNLMPFFQSVNDWGGAQTNATTGIVQILQAGTTTLVPMKLAAATTGYSPNLAVNTWVESTWNGWGMRGNARSTGWRG